MPRRFNERAKSGLVRLYESFLRRRSTFDYARELDVSQWRSSREIEEMQLQKLKRLLRHAQATCIFYRDLWGGVGVDPNAVRSLPDLQQLPIITREAFRENTQSIRSAARDLVRYSKTTGGSTGTPLKFEFDAESQARRVAASMRGYSWAGVGPATRLTYVWGTDLQASPLRRLRQNVHHWMYNRSVLSAFDLTEANVADVVQRIRATNPDILVGYTSALLVLAHGMHRHQLLPPRLQSIIVGAEKIYDFQRGIIESAFSAPVFETYGSREFMLIGAECEAHAGLHLSSEHLIVEIVDDAGRTVPDGVEGNVIVTDLHNRAMPFIRYAIGDRGIASNRQCTCGRPLPLLQSIVGRSLDVIRTPDGRKVPGELFPHLLKDYPVHRFQVVQPSLKEIGVRIIPNENWSDQHQRRCMEQLQGILGTEITIRIERVQSLPLSAAGKLRVVVGLAEDHA